MEIDVVVKFYIEIYCAEKISQKSDERTEKCNHILFVWKNIFQAL